jgi:gas vesicle protein
MAFAFGALAGAVVALLYAPAPGDETRRRLAERTREGRRRAEAAMREGREILSEHADQVGDAIDRGVNAFQQARKGTL